MEKFDDTTKEIEKLQNVESIRDNKDLASTLINIRTSVTYLSVGIIILLMLVSLFIISNRQLLTSI